MQMSKQDRADDDEQAIFTEYANALRETMKPSDLAKLKAMSRDELSALHFDLGMYVRNKFVYQNKELEKRLSRASGFYPFDADHLSSEIIERLWELLQEEA